MPLQGYGASVTIGRRQRLPTRRGVATRVSPVKIVEKSGELVESSEAGMWATLDREPGDTGVKLALAHSLAERGATLSAEALQYLAFRQVRPAQTYDQQWDFDLGSEQHGYDTTSINKEFERFAHPKNHPTRNGQLPKHPMASGAIKWFVDRWVELTPAEREACWRAPWPEVQIPF